jgi:dTDP-4-dehydrorhamnose 3,5-epimerase
MKIEPLKLPDTFKISLEPLKDERGYFMRTFDKAVFQACGLANDWVQENQSLSDRRGILRGLHFQRPPYAETKLVRVVSGAVFDVFVDLRKASPTYGQWDSVDLSADNHTVVYIPKGFAHGFCVVTNVAVVVYKVDACYAPDACGGVRWDDETLNIRWPTDKPFLSAKDKALPAFKDFASPF